MAGGIRSYSTTAANNNAATPYGWPEGQPPSSVNNVARQNMADLRAWYENPTWIDFGDTPTRVSNTVFTVATDLTARYAAGRRIQLIGATTGYATISSATYSAPDTTITVVMDSGNVPTSLTNVSVSALSLAPEGSDGTRRTAAEIAAGVTPTNYAYAAGDIRRYGALIDSSTDDTVAWQRAVDSAIQGNRQVFFPGSAAESKITSAINITAPVCIAGEGERYSRILAVACGAFSISAGVASVEMKSFRIALATRYTTTPNALTAIDINGTTASQCDYHLYRDLFIDGYQIAIQADAIRNTQIENVQIIFGLHGIIASQLTDSVKVHNCSFTGSHIAASYGIKIGDGTAATEGWIVTGNIIYGYDRAIWGLASANCNIASNILDQFGTFGVLLQSSVGACATWTITDNYIGGLGTCDSGIYCANSVAPSTGQDRGHYIGGNQIFAYNGSTLTNGILIDGTQERNHIIQGNRILSTSFDCNIAVGTNHIVVNNRWLGPGYKATVRNFYWGNVGTLISASTAVIAADPYAQIRNPLTYSASMTIDAASGTEFDIVATNATAFTINAPTNATDSKRITVTIRNTSGGALGAVTWNGVFKMSAWTQPANGFCRSIDFRYDANRGFWDQISQTGVDVPN